MSSSVALHIIYQGRVSLLNPELTSSASLAVYLTLESPMFAPSVYWDYWWATAPTVSVGLNSEPLF